jgi:hypothetical protein
MAFAAVKNRELDMKRVAVLIATILVAALAIPGVVSAQAPSNPTAPMTGMKPDRTTAPTATRKAMQEKEAVLRKKRAECRAQAKAEKVSLVKRPAYVKKCMSS